MKYGEINLQEILRVFSVLVFALGLLLFLQNDSFAQSDKILFEVTRSGFSRGTSKDVLRIYKSGRVDCESSEKRNGKTSNSKKTKCFQLGKTVIARLIKLASEPSFLKAKDEYDLPGSGIDYSSKRIIVSFLNKNSKTISLNSPPDFGDDMTDSLPEAVKEFISKIAEINDSFKLPSS